MCIDRVPTDGSLAVALYVPEAHTLGHSRFCPLLPGIRYLLGWNVTMRKSMGLELCDKRRFLMDRTGAKGRRDRSLAQLAREMMGEQSAYRAEREFLWQTRGVQLHRSLGRFAATSAVFSVEIGCGSRWVRQRGLQSQLNSSTFMLTLQSTQCWCKKSVVPPIRTQAG